MIKNYVLDTNVLLHDPGSIFKFEDNNLFLPIQVLEEVDKFKLEMTERGRNARQVARTLDTLRQKGSLAGGVSLEAGGVLRVYVPPAGVERLVTVDQDILRVVLAIKGDYPDQNTVFVTQDVNLRVRGDALQIPVQGYENQKVDADALFTGIVDIDVSGEDLNDFYNGALDVPPHFNLCENTNVVLKAAGDTVALGRVQKGRIQKLRIDLSGCLGIKAKNQEQAFALDLLLDPSVNLVTLTGRAGSGKTLLSLAAALSQVLNGDYQKVLVCRPIVPMGNDLGYLPGSVEEKLDPWMKPIFDNLDFIMLSGGKGKRAAFERLMEEGGIQVEPLTYIRGRSIPSQFILVDEAQNLSPHEAKTIITRAGQDTKIVMTGDPHQIDNPYVDSCSNGLSITANKLRGESMVGHVTLLQGERSALADVASRKL